MDPVTAIGLVSSIVQLIECTAKTIGYINHVKDAPKERARLAREATTLLSLLTDLRYRIDDAEKNDPWFSGLLLLGGVNGPLELFRGDMEVLAKKLTPETKLAKIGQRIVWPLDNKKMNDILTKIERLKTTINYALQKDIFRLTRAIEEQCGVIESHVVEVAVGLSKLESSRENQSRLDTINWLSNLNFPSKQIDTFSRRQEGTGNWILHTEAFQSWVDGIEPLLWCPGIPGAGKTVLASFVVNHLEQRFRNNDHAAVACIYCSYKERENQSTTNLIASLLKQLIQLRPEIPSEIVNLHERHLTKQTRPTLDEVSQLLKREIRSRSNVFIIIDALDELSDSDNTRDNFISELRSIQDDVRLMITSRHVTTIEHEFENAGRIEILASDEDVKLYLKARIGQERRLSRQLKGDTDLEETIVKTIAENAKGMFLLAQLHIDSLAKKQNKRDVRKALENLPAKLDDTYDEAMQRIKSQDKEDVDLAKRVLSWITCALEPLTIYQLQHALAIELGSVAMDEESLPDEDLLVSVCAGLVTTDQESNVIRLVHFTTQIYFERIRCKEFPNASMEIAERCLTYLSFESFTLINQYMHEGQLREMEEKYPLIGYAVQHWGDHARGHSEDIIKEMILDYLIRNRNTHLTKRIESSSKNWAQTNKATRSIGSQDFALGSSARFGLTHIVEHLIDQGQCDINHLHDLGYTALHIAAENGHEAMVRLLLMNGAQADAKTFSNESVLHVASTDAVIRLLLEHGAEINGKNDYGETVLHKVAEYGSEAVLQLLIQKGADVNSKAKNGDTPLHVAATHGRETIMRQILDAHPTVNTTNKVGDTALQTAIKKRQEPIVPILLERGADANVQNWEGATALHISTAYKLYKTMRLLIDSGVNIEAGDKAGQTSLYQSLEDKRAFKLLIESGANIEAKDQEGLTVLHWTTKLWKSKARETIALLLENGANIDTEDSRGRTALHIATETSKQSAVLLLLEKGANVHSKDHEGQTALHLAAELNDVSIMNMLSASTDTICDLNNKDIIGQAPLHKAAGLKRKLVWNLGFSLVQRETVIEPRACLAAVELLLEKGATVDLKDDKDQTAMLLAVQSLKHANQAQQATSSKRRRRNSAATVMSDDGGSLDGVSRWEEEMRDNARNNIRDTRQVIRLLLKHGADIEAKSCYGTTPLQIATPAGFSSLLLEPDRDADDEITSSTQSPAKTYPIRGFKRRSGTPLLARASQPRLTPTHIVPRPTKSHEDIP